MIRMYDEERKARVNEHLKTDTIEDILINTIDGDYSGYVIEDGVVTGVELYDEAE